MAVPFGSPFSYRFWDAFFLVFAEILTIYGSDVGSILAPFSSNSAYLFRILFSHVFYWFALISRALNPPTSLFYYCKTMIYGKPPNARNLRTSVIFQTIVALFWDPVWLEILTLVYTDFWMPFRMYFF